MSDEVFPISVELILAAILKKNGKIELKMSDLFGDFEGWQVAVEEGDSQSLTFELVKVQDES